MKLAEPEAKKSNLKPARHPVELIGQLWAWLFLLLLIIIFSFTGQGFFSLLNFQNILANMAIVLIMALGQTFVIIAGGIDLSTGYGPGDSCRGPGYGKF
jgi:ribose/xylose/arabinose/galactoside ABC-type transport system permease subunit